jgi:hypothetical protein|tara:strand:+ start:191 stop:523 length:333 start_codon:yes stop_codon:yes gene_type:complete
MPETKGKKFGKIIDLSVDKIEKAPRGATKDIDLELVEYLKSITKGFGVTLEPFVVDRANYPATEDGQLAFTNERQRIGAMLRSHAVEAGIGKISLNWHPDGHFPQASLRG